MKIEFSREEVQEIILQHARAICPSGKFNHVSERYSYLTDVTVSYVEPVLADPAAIKGDE